MNTNTQPQPGPETSGHTGAGLIGDLRTGIDAGREAREATDRALEREAQREAGRDSDPEASRTVNEVEIAGAARTAASGGASARDAFPDPLGTGAAADSGSLSGTSGGERASAGTNDANRSSRDHGNTLDD